MTEEMGRPGIYDETEAGLRMLADRGDLQAFQEKYGVAPIPQAGWCVSVSTEPSRDAPTAE